MRDELRERWVWVGRSWVGRLFLAALASLSVLAVGACGDSGSSTPASPDAGEVEPEIKPTADETAAWELFLDDARAQLDASSTPGASVAVVLHGRLLFASGLGRKAHDSDDAVTDSTRFRAASMSKMILAATAMTLVQEGKLDLHAPITRYLPWFDLQPPFDPNTVTLHHLLTHSSGFPCDTLLFCGNASSGEFEEYFSQYPQPLWAPPGAVHDYSNMGYALAAKVILAAAGRADTDFEALVRERIFAPAKMNTATYDATAAQQGDHATGHMLGAGGTVDSLQEFSDVDCPLFHPPGGLVATASDYGHFLELMLGKGRKVLTASSIAAMTTAHISTQTFRSQAYGYGLEVQDYPYHGHTLVWHGGSLSGYLSEMFMVPDFDFGVVVMVNATGEGAVNPDALAAAAMARFIPDQQKWPVTQTPSSTWAVYSGTYEDTYGLLGTFTVDVVPSGSSARVAIDAPDAYPAPIRGQMRQSAGNKWIMPDGTSATFYPGPQGEAATYFVTRIGVGKRK